MAENIHHSKIKLIQQNTDNNLICIIPFNDTRVFTELSPLLIIIKQFIS